MAVKHDATCFPGLEGSYESFTAELYDGRDVVGDYLKNCLDEVFGDSYHEKYTGRLESSSLLKISNGEAEEILIGKDHITPDNIVDSLEELS
ncbi:MAG: hypothetical protein ABEK16_03570 [Candidatus Nanohalobium sp.]